MEIREQANREGNVPAKGIRPRGAPFPIASPQTGYYAIPLLKPPQWTWEIPIYFFVGGAAGASAVIAAVAEWTGSNSGLARNARMLAAAGAVISPALLVSDLGRPSRFLNMLRVFKPQSAMSVGAWTVFFFSNFAIASFLVDRFENFVPRFMRKALAATSAGGAAATGLVMSSYTGVLIGATAIPVWNENVKTLPVHFAASGLNSAVGALELLGHDESLALNALGMGAAFLETAEGIKIEMDRTPALDPLRQGRNGWTVRIAGVLSGPVPLALRTLSLFTNRSTSRKLRRAAAICSLTGSLMTRMGWMQAGKISSKDYRLPLEIKAEDPLYLPEDAAAKKQIK